MSVSEAFEALAVILYGILALFLLFLFSWHQGSIYGMAGATVSAAATYLFQALQWQLDKTDHRVTQLLFVLAIIPVIIYGFALALVIAGV